MLLLDFYGVWMSLDSISDSQILIHDACRINGNLWKLAHCDSCMCSECFVRVKAEIKSNNKRKHTTLMRFGASFML